MITKEDIQENRHLFPETFTGTFASNKRLLRNRYGRAAIPRWNVALKNGKSTSLYQTLVAGMRSNNRTLKECKDLVKEATDKNDRDALVGLFEIVKPPVYDQFASKFALCRSLNGLRTSWWCNGLVSKILKKVDDLESDIFCPAWCHPWWSSRRNLKNALDSLQKRMDIKVFENFQRLYNAFASAQKEALSSRVGGKFKVKVQPRDSAEGLVHCTLELDGHNESLVVSGKHGEIVARIHDDGFAVVKNKQKYIDFLSKLNDDDEEGSFLNYIFQNVCSCVFCGRNLTVGTSIAQGAGDICYGRYGSCWKQTMAEQNGTTPVYTPGCFVDHLATQEVKDVAGRTAILPTVLCIASPVIRMFTEDNEDQNTEVLEYLRGTFTEDQLKTLAYYMETWLVYPFNTFGKKEPQHKFYTLEYSSIYGNRPTYHMMPVEPSNDIQQELIQHLIQHPRQASPSSFGYKREGFVLGYMMNNMDMLRLIDYLDIPFVREHILFQMEPLYHASMLDEYLVDGKSCEIDIQLPEKKKIDKNAPKKPKSAYKLFQTSKETVQTLKSKFLEAHGLDQSHTSTNEAIRLLYTDGNGNYQYPRKREHPIRGTVFAEWYAKEMPVHWKSMSDEEKKPFVDMAAEDKSRYDTEMEAYEPPGAISHD